MREFTCAQIDALLAAPARASSRAEWEAAFGAIKEECDNHPFAQVISDVRLPTYGNMPLRSVIGSGGVMTIVAALMRAKFIRETERD